MFTIQLVPRVTLEDCATKELHLCKYLREELGPTSMRCEAWEGTMSEAYAMLPTLNVALTSSGERLGNLWQFIIRPGVA